METGSGTGGAGVADRWVAGWMGWVSARPRTALYGLALLVLAALLAATRIGVDPDSSKMLSPELRAQQLAHEVNEAFPGLKTTVVVVVAAPTPDQADMAAAALAEALRARTEWIADLAAPATDPFFAAHGFLYRDVEAVEEMFTRLSASSNVIARLRSDQTVEGFARALDEAATLAEGAEIDPEALDSLYAEAATVFEAVAEGRNRPFNWSAVLDDGVAPGPTVRTISIVPRPDPGRLSPAKPALRDIQAAIAALPSELTDGVEITVTGEPALRAEELDSVLGTIWISLALSLALVAAILRIGLGSTGRAVLAFGALLVSLTLTTGFAALAAGQLNLVSVAFIVLMVGLGIDFAIHILAHVAEVRGTGAAPREAVVLTGRRSGLALALSAVTTSIAFLAFATTDFVGMAQLGLIGGVGVLIAFAVAATLIPAAVALAPGLAGAPAPATTTAQVRRRDPGFLAAAVLLATGIAAFPALQARFDPDPMGLRNPDSASVRAFHVLAADPETTPYRASVLAPARAEADAMAARLDTGVIVGATVTISDLLPEAQDEKIMFLDIAAPSIEHAVRGVPTDLTAQAEGSALGRLSDRLAGSEGPGGQLGAALDAYLAEATPERTARLNAALFRTFPLMLGRLDALLTADFVSEDKLPALFRDRFVNAEGIFRVEVLPNSAITRAEDVFAFADAITEIVPDAAGGPVQLAAAGRSVGAAMLMATALAAVASLVLAYAATRRIIDTVAILVPLVVAGVLTAGASVMLDMPFNYANVIVLPLLIGIGVDSGIHMALRESRAPGAVFATSTPRAVLFSALTTMAAFGTLALSDHRGTASMGALLAISMTAAVVSVMALTPAILRWSRRTG